MCIEPLYLYVLKYFIPTVSDTGFVHLQNSKLLCSIFKNEPIVDLPIIMETQLDIGLGYQFQKPLQVP